MTIKITEEAVEAATEAYVRYIHEQTSPVTATEEPTHEGAIAAALAAASARVQVGGKEVAKICAILRSAPHLANEDGEIMGAGIPERAADLLQAAYTKEPADD